MLTFWIMLKIVLFIVASVVNNQVLLLLHQFIPISVRPRKENVHIFYCLLNPLASVWLDKISLFLPFLFVLFICLLAASSPVCGFCLLHWSAQARVSEVFGLK